jgi:hypothetical protein
MALGICDAFRDAELLANAIDEGFSGKGLEKNSRSSAALKVIRSWPNYKRL